MIRTFYKGNNRDENSLISVIPSNVADLRNSNAITELYYPNAGDYRQMSFDDIKGYIRGYYLDVLSYLDPEEILKQIDYTELVSNEETDSLAKRHIVSEWLRLYTGVDICESVYDNKRGFVSLERPTFIKPILEEVIRETTTSLDKYGYESIRACFCIQKAEKCEMVLSKMGNSDEFSDDLKTSLINRARTLRRYAAITEEKYRNSMDKKARRKTLTACKYPTSNCKISNR